MSDTNQKGDVGEAAFMLEAFKREYWVAKMPQDCPYDCVLDRRDGTLLRVQVKYRTQDKNGAVKVKRVLHKVANVHERCSYNASNIDALAVYVPDNGVVYLIPIAEFEDVEEVTFRLSPPKNNQQSRVRLITTYSDW
jgi:hypothetical protein